MENGSIPFKNIFSALDERTTNLEIFLEDTRKLLSFYLVVVYPRLDGHCWILGAWNSI